MDLRQRAEQIGALFGQRARRFTTATRFVKIGMIVLATAVAGVAQFLAVPMGEGPTFWQAIGLAATAIVALGAVIVLVIDQDASRELDEARGALEEARISQAEAERWIDDFDEYANEVLRAVELYSAMSAMRGVCERALGSGNRDLVSIIDTMLEATERSLPLAMGVRQEERWTICVYRAEPGENGAGHRLRCIAHLRAIKCPIAKARVWDEGVGVGGIAYSKAREVIVPDLTDPALGTIFDLGSLAREYDRDRYRSMAAVPVMVDHDNKPWGVVIGTNDQAHHFTVDNDPGIKTVEAVRALAGMLALAVSMCEDGAAERDSSSATPPAPSVSSDMQGAG